MEGPKVATIWSDGTVSLFRPEQCGWSFAKSLDTRITVADRHYVFDLVRDEEKVGTASLVTNFDGNAAKHIGIALDKMTTIAVTGFGRPFWPWWLPEPERGHVVTDYERMVLGRLPWPTGGYEGMTR